MKVWIVEATMRTVYVTRGERPSEEQIVDALESEIREGIGVTDAVCATASRECDRPGPFDECIPWRDANDEELDCLRDATVADIRNGKAGT